MSPPSYQGSYQANIVNFANVVFGQLDAEGGAGFRTVRVLRSKADCKESRLFVQKLHRLMRKGALLLNGLVLLLGSGGSNQEDSAAGKHTTGGSEQASKADLDAASDISSGKCPKDVSTMNEWPRAVPCELPADRIFEALAEALGKPSPSPPE
jgi:hypothetical protein